MTSTITRWRRRHGLALFGYAQENFHHHHQLLLVWGLGRPARHEVYRWPVGTGSTEVDSARGDAPFGSREAYRRIQAHAELVYAGHDWEAGRAAFNGRYPDDDIATPLSASSLPKSSDHEGESPHSEMKRLARAVTSKLRARGVKAECGLCAHNDWSIHALVNLVLSPSRQTIPQGGKAMALSCVALICTNCGNTVLLNMPVLDRAPIKTDSSASPPSSA